jgi:serine/threonine protein kinase
VRRVLRKSWRGYSAAIGGRFTSLPGGMVAHVVQDKPSWICRMKANASLEAGEGDQLRRCPVCGTPYSTEGDDAGCPVCLLHQAMQEEATVQDDMGDEGRFDHYELVRRADRAFEELGRGAMGVTYKAFDTVLRHDVALKVIDARIAAHPEARERFLREARAAARLRHPNVASVFYYGTRKSDGQCFYAMELVEGETLQARLRRAGPLSPALALEVVAQVAKALVAAETHGLVHRDLKPANLMLVEGPELTVKVIDFGLAKAVAAAAGDADLSHGGFVGTPAFASPEQIAGATVDIRSDLYSLGITLWKMLTGHTPFRRSSTEVMNQHQYAPLPLEQVKGVPQPVVALLEALLEKDPARRFQSPADLLNALSRVADAVKIQRTITPQSLRLGTSGRPIEVVTNIRETIAARRVWPIRWLLLMLVIGAGAILAVNVFFGPKAPAPPAPSSSSQAVTAPEKSIAVLPFESLSENKSDSYFADGVQDEILSNVARISQLKVISRTSVMQYRPDARRDLRQIAKALGVAHILEGTVRRASNRVRITIELVDAGSDHAIWSETYDRDLTDIFAIQSEVAETIARKLTATLSPEEKKRIETKPTENLAAYDLYLRAKELVVRFGVAMSAERLETPLSDAISLLNQAVRLDPKFTLAYCELARANGLLFVLDPTPERRALGEAAINSALRLQPDLPEVHLAYAYHLSYGYSSRDYQRAREQLTIAKRGLANNAEVFLVEAYMDRRQGDWEKAISEFKEAIALDPLNTLSIRELAVTYLSSAQFSAGEKEYDRLTQLLPDQPMLKVEKALIPIFKNGDDSPLRSAIDALPASMADDTGVLTIRLCFALTDRDWPKAKDIIEKFKGREDNDQFAYGRRPVPIGCYSILIARLQGERAAANPSFTEIREQLNQKVKQSPENANLLSQLAVVDALLGNKESAINNAKRARDMMPVSKDAIEGMRVLKNLALVYAWTDELDLAFETLVSLKNTPVGLRYGQFKLDPYWDPLRKDPRFEKLLAELAPKD